MHLHRAHWTIGELFVCFVCRQCRLGTFQVNKSNKVKCNVFDFFVLFRCKIPECDIDRNSRLIEYDQPWLSLAIPSNDSVFENCFRYAPVNLDKAHRSMPGNQNKIAPSILKRNKCSAQQFDLTSKIGCTEFVYKSDEKNLQTEVTFDNIFP